MTSKRAKPLQAARVWSYPCHAPSLINILVSPSLKGTDGENLEVADAFLYHSLNCSACGRFDLEFILAVMQIEMHSAIYFHTCCTVFQKDCP